MTEEPAKKDIDFDELDKAVNSLMSKVANETLDEGVEKTKTLDINATLKADEKPRYDALGKAAETIGDETLVTDAEVELVDDLTKLPPDADISVAEPVTSVEPSPEPVIPVVATPPAVKRPSSGRFMDMVHPSADMRTAAPKQLVAAAERTTSAASIASIPAEQPPLDTPPSEVPLTPFLPDAKVEKRPLGSEAPTGANSPEPIGGEKPTEEDDGELVETGPINSEHKPDNGGSDHQRALNAGDFEKETATDQQLSKIESNDTAAATEKTGVSPEGAIYDTTSYHQPISHPPKQKSGWGTVFIIVIIIILLAAVAGGAYLYFGIR